VIRLLVRAGPAGLPTGKLGESLHIAANALTFHLQKLAHVGLVTSQRQGQFIVYSAVFPDLLELTNSLIGACCADSVEKCGPACPSIGCEPDGIRFADSDDNPATKEKGVQNE
jgi:DNA-binding transcriptional ArsR family regulator